MSEHNTEIQIYNKYSGKSEEELENIIEQINQFENLHIDKEAHYQQKNDEFHDSERDFYELSTEFKKKPTVKKKEQINKLELKVGFASERNKTN